MNDEQALSGRGARGAGREVSRLGVGSPRLNDYFGAWAIAEEHAAGLIRMAERINVRLHVLRADAVAEAEAAEQAGGAAAELDGFGSGWGRRCWGMGRR